MLILELLKGLLILGLIFIPLEQLFYLHRQRIFRPGWLTDLTYFFIGHFVGKVGLSLSLGIGTILVTPLLHLKWQETISAQPILFQLIEAIVIADLGYYLAHRLLHTVPELWKFHAVHHSIESIDWLATVRVHPVDQIFTKFFQVIPLVILGFSAETWGIYTLFSALVAFYIHANIRLKIAGLKWVIATPQFHHWHHIQEAEMETRNLAAQLPLIDWLFGTLYFSQSKIPNSYGIKQSIPRGYLGQLIYPFRRYDYES
ncbi:sterol desaturase family protein [Planktothrix sp. FACHB-1365]|uniref:sterol desaturase family protein n=1 Tax=Planktothrix sp. FACHB-1365 TaxID=2692855 RepID=UPI001686500D|nr:sterol desaturase family protein [Planktothrix sp. FACHB-1365]MBD2484693.1 sterol desaturase family protein [Planktothrix sp. FACHB-1365]